MITPRKACELARAIYKPIDPGVFEQVIETDGITVGIASVDGCMTFTFAGSECTEDWLRDFEAIPFEHPQLGVIHQGAYEGMAGVWEAILPKLGGQPNLSIHGHSLGCMHAAIMAGLCSVNGVKVDQLYLFAPPRVSYSSLRDLLAIQIPTIRAYRNGLDPVPMVPPDIFSHWVPIAEYIPLNEKPKDGDLDIFGFHCIDLYWQGVSKL